MTSIFVVQATLINNAGHEPGLCTDRRRTLGKRPWPVPCATVHPPQKKRFVSSSLSLAARETRGGVRTCVSEAGPMARSLALPVTGGGAPATGPMNAPARPPPGTGGEARGDGLRLAPAHSRLFGSDMRVDAVMVLVPHGQCPCLVLKRERCCEAAGSTVYTADDLAL